MLWVNNSHFAAQTCRVAVQTHADEIDVSMLDSLVSWITPLLAPPIDQLPTRILPPQEPGYGLFATADGQQMTLSSAGEDPMWVALCKLFERNQFALLCEQQRSPRAGEIWPYLREAITRWPYDALYQALEARGMAFGPVRRLHQVLKCPQPLARRMTPTLKSAEGVQKLVRQPLLFDGEGGAITRPAPALGQHTAELLGAAATLPAT